MKIAVASEGRNVSEHFGHCAQFVVFDVEGREIVGDHEVANPGHAPGVLPAFLKNLGARVIISGGMGGSAIGLFGDLGIQVITGARGDVTEVVRQFLAGVLETDSAVCQEHAHRGACGS